MTRRVFVAGSGTAIGRAFLATIRLERWGELVGAGADEPDLGDLRAVETFFAREAPCHVVFCGARSGGIGKNVRSPADLAHDNLLAAAHVLGAAARQARHDGAGKLLYVAPSCVYPRDCPQPMAIESLGAGPLEPTSAPYAQAMLAALELARAYRRQYGVDFTVAIAANPYGPWDDFDPDDAHVVGALLARVHQARLAGDSRVEIWGTGRARREFLYAGDLARAGLFLLERHDDPGPVNIGSGEVLSIADLARAVARVVGFEGEFAFDTTRPDGAPVKALDSRPIARLGWRPDTRLDTGLSRTYDALVESLAAAALPPGHD